LNCSQAPSALPDQRVARLPSTVLAGRLPSFVLAVTAEAGGVISVSTPGAVVGVGVGVGSTGLGVAVGVGVGQTSHAAAPKMLTSVTLFIVGLVLPMLPWPR
jgi:hypothetical protein